MLSALRRLEEFLRVQRNALRDMSMRKDSRTEALAIRILGYENAVDDLKIFMDHKIDEDADYYGLS